MTDLTRNLPNEIMVWHSHERLDHIGTWATTRYPEEAVAYVPKTALAEAQAAQALAVERSADAVLPADDPGVWRGSWFQPALQEAQARVRALADPTGVKLMAERDGWREGSRVQAMASESLRAERDTLAAVNAALEAKVERLVEALQFVCNTDGFSFAAAHRVARAALAETAPEGDEQ